MSASAPLDIAPLERRRRLSLRAAEIALAIGVVGFPLGLLIGGSDSTDGVSGALLLAAIAGIVACPWIVRAWQSFMRTRMLATAVQGRPDIRHVDSASQLSECQRILYSNAFNLAMFRDSGLVEAFESAGVSHVLTGEAQGLPYAIAEITLLDAKDYRLFGGVLASFRLSHPRPGLTIVARDHGLLGNLLAHAGSAVERLPLEDPSFEGVFEVYGTDQVGGRVVLTTTMLERLKALDQVARARGFACAFLENQLLIAFGGMSWRCPSWRILKPVDSWLQGYAASLAGLIDLPVDIVHALNLEPPSTAWASSFVPTAWPSIPIGTSSGQVFSSALWRVVGEGGMPLVYIASGSVFGGVALFGAWYGIKEGYSSRLFWYFWGLISAGLIYGTFTIAGALRDVAKLAWRWDAPLRALKRP